MRPQSKKKFVIVAPILGGPYYWCVMGRGYTTVREQAHRFSEEDAKELVDKEPLLKMEEA